MITCVNIRMPVIAGPYERNVMECQIILQYITSYIIILHLKCLNAGCKMLMYYLLCWFWMFFVYHTQCCVSSPSCAILSSHIPECLPPKYLRLQVLGVFATLQWICAEQAFVHEMRRALNLRKYLHCWGGAGPAFIHQWPQSWKYRFPILHQTGSVALASLTPPTKPCYALSFFFLIPTAQMPTVGVMPWRK